MDGISVTEDGRVFQNGLLLEEPGLGLVNAPVLQLIRFDRKPTLAMYWYDSNKQGQFHFNLTAQVDDLRERLAANPERFAVVYVGLASDWPFAESRAEINHRLPSDMLVVYTVEHLGLSLVGGIVTPVNFIAGLACIGHPEFGFLKPKPFFDLEVLHRVERGLNGGRTIREMEDLLDQWTEVKIGDAADL